MKYVLNILMIWVKGGVIYRGEISGLEKMKGF